MKIVNCTRCDNTGWVCETHKYRPWDGSNACGCGGAGMPCPDCNPFDRDHPPSTERCYSLLPWHKRAEGFSMR